MNFEQNGDSPVDIHLVQGPAHTNMLFLLRMTRSQRTVLKTGQTSDSEKRLVVDVPWKLSKFWRVQPPARI